MDKRVDMMGLQAKERSSVWCKYFYSRNLYKKILGIFLLICLISVVLSGSLVAEKNDYLISENNDIRYILMNSPPHPPIPMIIKAYQKDALPSTGVFLRDVPTSNWTYGCSATAAGMVFGYYDRTGYPNIYTGPANGGICPLDNLGQGTPDNGNGYPNPGSCYIIATEDGLDGITTPGHVDDYWISKGSPGPDPWTIILNEGFEDSFPPDGWINSGWIDSLYGFAHSGSHWAYSWSSGDNLTTPLLDFGSNTELSFWYAAENSGHPMTLEVYCNDDLVFSDYGFTHTAYNQAIVDLSSYTGFNRISFIGLVSDVYGQEIDDVKIVSYKNDNEHQWAKCTADFMGTNQWKWDTNLNGLIDKNEDGATTLYYNPNPSMKLYDYVPPSSYGLPQTALAHGMKLFAESRGYWNNSGTNEVYTQLTSFDGDPGFSFSDYKDEIDNGYPVIIQLEGHSMVGIGYDEIKGNIIYVHDTWDNYVHPMVWGTSYNGMSQFAVTVLHLEPPEEPSIPVLSWYPNVEIPSEQVDMTVYNGDVSYFNIELEGIYGSQHVTNGSYWGWCFEKSVQMTRNMTHPIKMCHSFDPNMPAAFQGVDWSEINYIINRDDLYPMDAVQDAIWSVIEGTKASTVAAQQLVNEAEMYGSSFIPQVNDTIAVLLFLDPEAELPGDYPSVQNTFIEVNLTYTACGLDYWVNNTDIWPSEFKPNDLVGKYFDLPEEYDVLEDIVLEDILTGAIPVEIPLNNTYYILLKQSIIALLNTNSDCSFYPINYDQLIVSVHDAFISEENCLNLTKILETYNLIGCSCED
jgi:hypothetical protein